jgi:hypothetical protein
MRDLRKRRYWVVKYGCKNRVDAAGNPIEFRLTFDDWWQIWEASGKWNLCGNRKGQYCMSRVNDIGHYEVGNVFIQLHSENIKQGNIGRTRSEEWVQKQSAAHKGHKLSPETIAKRTAARKANREKRQQGNT